MRPLCPIYAFFGTLCKSLPFLSPDNCTFVYLLLNFTQSMFWSGCLPKFMCSNSILPAVL